MVNVWIISMASVIVVSFISLVGIFGLWLGTKFQKGLVLLMIGYAAGAMLGDALLHLLPKAYESGVSVRVSGYILLGIMIFFVIEKVFQWRHTHSESGSPKPFALVNLVGDGVHNFIDGMLIAGSYIVAFPVGIATTVAVAAHEIPQELGDYAVLIHGGFSKFKALMYNFITAMVAILGALLILIMGLSATTIATTVIPFAVGGFLYIAAADLIPEIHKETRPSVSLMQFAAIIAGIGSMVLLLFLE